MSRSKNARRVVLSIVLLMLAFASLGAGPCVVVAEGEPGTIEGPGENAEAMDDQEVEIMNESDR
jgi:hypothetical protein